MIRVVRIREIRHDAKFLGVVEQIAVRLPSKLKANKRPRTNCSALKDLHYILPSMSWEALTEHWSRSIRT